MPLVTSTEMFKKAYAGGYAIGAFNVNNMETIQGIVEAGKECNSPLILQVSAGARKYANPVYLRHLVLAAEETTGLPIVLHLDHGADFESCKSAIEDGFTSVMIDASHHAFKENIEITKKVVEFAHDRGVVVEAELGQLAGIEDAVNVKAEDACFTQPDEVCEFTEKTGCDSLAIAIGTSHGAYKFKPGQKQTPARIPHRSARRFFRAAGQSGDHQPVRRKNARRDRHPRRDAQESGLDGGLQDQHRL